jgi:hypothetical protein
VEDTVCPIELTNCPLVTTLCPSQFTSCQTVYEPSFCPVIQTQCPNDGMSICPPSCSGGIQKGLKKNIETARSVEFVRNTGGSTTLPTYGTRLP